jgi:hypothetical protein
VTKINDYPDEQDPFDNTLTALKVDGNEKWGGSDSVAIEGYSQFECAISLYNSFFLFPVATAL